MRSTRYVTGTGRVVGALTVTVTALGCPVMSGSWTGAAANTGADPVSTEYGALTALDREFLVKLRAVGLWESPTGQTAPRRGTTPTAKTAGGHLIDGHSSLDESVREITSQSGVTPPNRPTIEAARIPAPTVVGATDRVRREARRHSPSAARRGLRSHRRGHHPDPGLCPEFACSAVGRSGERHRTGSHDGAGANARGEFRPKRHRHNREPDREPRRHGRVVSIAAEARCHPVSPTSSALPPAASSPRCK